MGLWARVCRNLFGRLNTLLPSSTSSPNQESTPTNNSRSDSHQAPSIHDLQGDNLAYDFPTIVEPSSPTQDASISHFTQPSDAHILNSS